MMFYEDELAVSPSFLLYFKDGTGYKPLYSSTMGITSIPVFIDS